VTVRFWLQDRVSDSPVSYRYPMPKRRLRTVLSNELGLEPCPRLQQLHQAILSGDATLEPDEIFTQAGPGRLAAR